MPQSPSDAAPDLGGISSVLVVKPSSLGDIVHTLPAIALIRRARPDLRIRWIANPEWLPLLEGHPHVDEVIPFPRHELAGWNAVAKFRKWSRRLREPEPPGLALDFQGLLRSAAIARRSGARLVAGLSDAREGARLFYHHTVPVDPGAHAVDRYLCLPRALGLDDGGPVGFHLPPGILPAGFDLPDHFVLLHPFSRGRGKSLDPSSVERLCLALAPHPVVLVGKVDLPACVNLPPGSLNLLNRTSLRELIGLMQAARFIVSVDSGPMHLAAALTANVLSLHAWSDPRKVGPYRPDAWIWKDGHLARADDWSSSPHAPLPNALPNPESLDTIAAFVSARMAGQRTPSPRPPSPPQVRSTKLSDIF